MVEPDIGELQGEADGVMPAGGWGINHKIDVTAVGRACATRLTVIAYVATPSLRRTTVAARPIVDSKADK